MYIYIVDEFAMLVCCVALAIFGSVATIAILFVCKFYKILTRAKLSCHGCLMKKTVIVTGGNRGMGYWIALDAAKRGAHLIVACKRKEEAERACAAITKASNNHDVVAKQLNLASFRSIRTFAFEIAKTERRVDVLVNNAGACRPNGLSEDGFHPTFQINALAPFLLTLLLLNILRSSGNSRVVNVTTSQSLLCGDMLPSFVDKKDGYLSYLRNYHNSKRCLNLLMSQLSSRLKGGNVAIYTSVPRDARTQIRIYQNAPDCWRFVKKWILFYFLYEEPEVAAQNTIYCGFSEALAGKSGRFWRDGKECQLKGGKGIDMGTLEAHVWNSCLELIKLRPNEVKI